MSCDEFGIVWFEIWFEGILGCVEMRILKCVCVLCGEIGEGKGLWELEKFCEFWWRGGSRGIGWLWWRFLYSFLILFVEVVGGIGLGDWGCCWWSIGFLNYSGWGSSWDFWNW